MSRVFWDSMLFIYLLEEHPIYFDRAQQLYRRSAERGDMLFTSYLAIGEVMAGAARSAERMKPAMVRGAVDELGFDYLPFDAGAVETFSRLRGVERVKIADAINLSCAASAGMDLFLTGDRQLMKLDIAGIQFIADFETPIL